MAEVVVCTGMSYTYKKISFIAGLSDNMVYR